MFELFSNILLCLIPAFLLGLLLGWLIWGNALRAAKAKLKSLETPAEDTVLQPIELVEVLPETPPNLPFGVPYAKFDRRDNLKAINGIDEATERKLNAYGIYTFEQVAHFTPQNILKLGSAFDGFDNRLIQENWIEQCLKLHAREYKEKLI
jgi:predicted flap endonuclease-1-like 5' DNA nuclease